jgi:hypothetical protein
LTEPPRFLSLSGEMVLRSPPTLCATTPLPCDLAHRIFLEFEGIDARWEAGSVVLSEQGGVRSGNPLQSGGRSFPMESITPAPSGLIQRPGTQRLRAVLEPDPELGWADPEIRSIWPGRITTNWCEVEIVRR